MSIRVKILLSILFIELVVLVLMPSPVKAQDAICNDTNVATFANLTDFDFNVIDGTYVLAFRLLTSGVACCGGKFSEVGAHFDNLKQQTRLQGEDLESFVRRYAKTVTWGDLTSGQQTMCNVMFTKYPKVEWVVTENYYRGELKPDRPRYANTPEFPSVKKEIGRATLGEPCGQFVANYGNSTDYEWRTNADGVTACRKK